MTPEYEAELVDWAWQRLEENGIEPLSIRFEEDGQRQCIIRHSKGGSNGSGSTYLRALVNAMGLSVNVRIEKTQHVRFHETQAPSE